MLESAITTIMDFEDSVAAVDADDKVLGYRNWLGLNRGDLTEEVSKGGKTLPASSTRTAPTPCAGRREITLPGRSLLFVRNVGHLMTNDAIVDADGQRGARGHSGRAVHRPHRDARAQVRQRGATGRWSTAAPARSTSSSRRCTDPTRSRSPVSCSAASRTCSGCRRPRSRSASWTRSAAPRQPAGMHQGRRRPGGVHQHRLPGPYRRRDPHLDGSRADDPQGSDEEPAMDHGLRGRQCRCRSCRRTFRPSPDRQGYVGHDRPDGRHGRAEDRPAQGGCQHRVGSFADRCHAARHALPPGGRVRRAEGTRQGKASGPRSTNCSPFRSASELAWSPEEIREEVDNNCQSILGYVVRWIDQGVGCSKVPDIHDTALMEDRATLRISSQLLANWLRHGVITAENVRAGLGRMAPIVDAQNAGIRPTGRWHPISIPASRSKPPRI